MMTKSKHGGQRNELDARFDLIPFEGLEAVAKVMALGESRYGRHPDNPSQPNWTGLDLSTDQSPLNHAVRHIYAHAAGDESEDNLAAAASNLLMLIWFRDNPSSPYYGLRYPAILATGDVELATPPAESFITSTLRSLGIPCGDQER